MGPPRVSREPRRGFGCLTSTPGSTSAPAGDAAVSRRLFIASPGRPRPGAWGQGRKEPAARAESCSTQQGTVARGCRAQHTTLADKPPPPPSGQGLHQACARVRASHTRVYTYIHIYYLHTHIYTYTHARHPQPCRHRLQPRQAAGQAPSEAPVLPINPSVLKTQCHIRSCQSLAENRRAQPHGNRKKGG